VVECWLARVVFGGLVRWGAWVGGGLGLVLCCDCVRLRACFCWFCVGCFCVFAIGFYQFLLGFRWVFAGQNQSKNQLLQRSKSREVFF
jgi:hypothetical protein